MGARCLGWELDESTDTLIALSNSYQGGGEDPILNFLQSHRNVGTFKLHAQITAFLLCRRTAYSCRRTPTSPPGHQHIIAQCKEQNQFCV